MIVVLITSFVFAICSAWYDHDQIFVDHKPRFILRVTIGVIISGMASSENVGLIPWIWAIHTFGFGAMFYLIFDYAHNLMKGLSFWYQGTTSEIDKSIRYLGITPMMILIFKAILLITYLILIKNVT